MGEKTRPLAALAALAALLLLAACGGGVPAGEPSAGAGEPSAGSMLLTSSAFDEGAAIPTRYTCDGDGVSPPLHWDGAPNGTQSFVLVVDDPDAPGGTFTHRVLYNIPAATSSLAEGASGGGVEGKTSFGAAAYGGPCPPPGDNPHRYQFTLYALDVAALNVHAGAERSAVESAMQPHILARAELLGRYQRP